MAGLNSTPSYFTNRLRELAVLAQIADDLLAGRPHHVALFGLRRNGKTLVCQEQVRRLQAGGQVTPVYLDMEDLVSSPEMFAQRYVGWKPWRTGARSTATASTCMTSPSRKHAATAC